MGPRVPMTAQNPKVKWVADETMQNFVFDLRTICHDFSKNAQIGGITVDGLNKCSYWIAQIALYNSILEQILPAVFRRETTCSIHPKLSLQSFRVAAEFFWRRYLFGLSVLDVDIRNQAWLPPRIADRIKPLSMNNTYAARILRGSHCNIIYMEHLRRLGHLFRQLVDGTEAEIKQAITKVVEIFEYLQMMGVGRIVEDESHLGNMIFQKRHYFEMPTSSQKYLRKIRVPSFHFGVGDVLNNKRPEVVFTPVPLSGDSDGSDGEPHTKGAAKRPKKIIPNVQQPTEQFTNSAASSSNVTSVSRRECKQTRTQSVIVTQSPKKRRLPPYQTGNVELESAISKNIDLPDCVIVSQSLKKRRLTVNPTGHAKLETDVPKDIDQLAEAPAVKPGAEAIRIKRVKTCKEEEKGDVKPNINSDSENERPKGTGYRTVSTAKIILQDHLAGLIPEAHVLTAQFKKQLEDVTHGRCSLKFLPMSSRQHFTWQGKCKESRTCDVSYTIYFFLCATDTNEAHDYTFYQHEDHAHGKTVSSRCKERVMGFQMQKVASEFMQEHSGEKLLKSRLRQHLKTKGFRASDVPLGRALTNWIQRESKKTAKEKVPTGPAVESLAASVREWKALSPNIAGHLHDHTSIAHDELVLVGPHTLDTNRGYVPFSCRAFLNVAASWKDSMVCAGTDVKMGMIAKGWGLAVIGFIAKWKLLDTTIGRTSNGLQIHMPCFGYTFVPFLFSLLKSETEVNFTSF